MSMGVKTNIRGQVVNGWTAIAPTTGRDNHSNILWEIQHKCGQVAYTTANRFRNKKLGHCTCEYPPEKEFPGFPNNVPTSFFLKEQEDNNNAK